MTAETGSLKLLTSKPVSKAFFSPFLPLRNRCIYRATALKVRYDVLLAGKAVSRLAELDRVENTSLRFRVEIPHGNFFHLSIYLFSILVILLGHRESGVYSRRLSAPGRVHPGHNASL